MTSGTLVIVGGVANISRDLSNIKSVQIYNPTSEGWVGRAARRGLHRAASKKKRGQGRTCPRFLQAALDWFIEFNRFLKEALQAGVPLAEGLLVFG